MRQTVSIVVDPRAPLEDLVRSHEDVFLDASGCPICEYCADAEDQFFRWFDIEAFAEPSMHARLRRSVGFCPRHERRALGIRQLAPVPAIVRGALDQLGADPPARGECPACESVRQAREHAEGMLATVMGSRPLSAQYAERDLGACLAHLSDPNAFGEGGLARPLAERLRRDLATSGVLELAAGRDGDAALRVALRAMLPAALAADPPSSAEAERATWQLDACPVCHAAGRAERRYLDWRRHEERADAIDLDQDPGTLCAAHLHDLAAADPRAGARAATRVRERWCHELDGLLKRWPPGPSARRRLLTNGRRRAPAPRLRPTVCPACRARDGAEDRHLDLIVRLLAQRPYAEAYESAHGLCLRHALRAGDGPAAPRIRHAVHARLLALEWEIAEAARKQGWEARHERPGPEQTARLRLAALLDGATFLGGPARPLP
ncbi:MAG TPA: hypothetical protein VH834_20815 [Solirubrobacteraceae bacterium]